MENKKLKVNVNLRTGTYVFDNEEKIVSMPMVSEEVSFLKSKKALEEELKEEYGFSEAMISRVDPILYKNLIEYDSQNGTSYTTRYLNVVAKEIDKKENEPMAVYLDRCADIRKKVLKETGIELTYVVPKKSEMKGITFMSLLDRLEAIRMARRQIAIGAEIVDKPIYDENIVGIESQSIINTSVIDKTIEEQENIIKSKMAMPSFLQEVLDKKEPSITLPEENSKVDQKVVPGEATVIAKKDIDDEPKAKNITSRQDKVQQTATAKKTLSRRQTIQASKKAMRESRKMKNVYKRRQAEADSRSKVSTAQPKKDRVQHVRQEQQPNMPKVKDSANEKELKFIPIQDGKMVGIDENRPTAIVKTFVIPDHNKEQDAIVAHQSNIKPEILVTGMPKKENSVHRYKRKLKDKTDSIKNRIAMSKDRFKKIAAVAAVASVVIVAGVLTIPKAIATIPLGTEHASEITIQAYDGVEQVAVKELEVDATAPIIEISEASSETTSKPMSYIRDAETTNIGQVGKEEALASTTTKTVDFIQEDEIVEVKTEPEMKADSTSYLESVKVGTKMTIDSGKYFERPDGTGNYGRFENHAGETKIINKIGIATKEGYISISSDELTLLDLKQMYPEAKFSYHIVDEKGHTLGWLTSESIDKIIEQQVDDGMDR